MDDDDNGSTKSLGTNAGLAAAGLGGGIAIEIATGNSAAALFTGLAVIGVPLIWRRLRR